VTLKKIATIWGLLMGFCLSGGPAAAGEPARTSELARFHRQLLTIDSHDDIPPNFATPEADPGRRGDMQVDLVKMAEGGLDTAFFVVYVGQTRRTPENYARAQTAAMVKFNAIHRMVRQYPERIGLARRADDIERLHAAGKLAAVICIENGYVIGKDLALLDKYYALGARYMTLTHMGHNDIGDSSNPKPELGDAAAEHGGLSAFGRQVIGRMNALGMMVDVSHTAKSTTLQAITLSKAPVIASHSGARAIADVARNLDDEELRALAASGGVAQMVALGAYVDARLMGMFDDIKTVLSRFGLTSFDQAEALPPAKRKAFFAAIKTIRKKWLTATVADFVDHIDHAVQVAGVDHVGISSDFGGGGGVIGWSDAAQSMNVTRELLKRGYSRADIAKIWGGNLLRVMRQVERVAARLKTARQP
jgi:membrane dipeptidase